MPPRRCRSEDLNSPALWPGLRRADGGRSGAGRARARRAGRAREQQALLRPGWELAPRGVRDGTRCGKEPAGKQATSSRTFWIKPSILRRVPTTRPFRRDRGGERIDGASELNRLERYVVECRWRETLSDVRRLDSLYGGVGPLGRTVHGPVSVCRTADWRRWYRSSEPEARAGAYFGGRVPI